ncbi:hypothetical protein OEA41_000878 [Lepraria neglecta]|uniref:Septin-type G domain-containing protein n=1 Tax=Lepraria neglecta TaxID=209136 RepID=A0AAD9ZGM7_9LECA|nr:hypothetical protein OEA41_000878 [Lepraria neglecta]
MATEEELEGSSTVKPERGSDSTYGVQSLQSTIYEAPSLYKDKKEEGSQEDDGDSQSGRRRSTLKPKPKLQTRDFSRESVEQSHIATADSSPSHPGQDGPSPPSMSHSLASLSLDSQAPLSSLPSSPKSTSNRSFRPSDEESMDDGGSQAIASSEDDDAEPQSEVQDSAPQLIMPSIKMPSRRPFTERGKSMGRLKVLIAGDSGVGKTSLIKSIVQTCEDIVHVDPLSPNLPTIGKLTSPKSKSKQDKPSVRTTQHITEVFASTKPYPSWWSDIEDTKVFRRRKSMGDTVLERNLCFVDTPGYSNGISRIETIQSILQYIEIQLTKPFAAPTASEGDIAGLLSGSGGTQVDVIFYLIARELKDEDILFLQRLAAITNVIPMIAKSDTLSPEETEMLRRSIDKLQQADIRLFTFSSESRATKSSFTICSAPSDDDDNMDASMLMSPDYVQPLIPSELASLVQQVFQPDNIACLRHLAAKKLVHAQGSRIFSMSTAIQRSASSPLSNCPDSLTSTSSSSNTIPSIVSPTHVISPYNQARIADHTQQEEKLAQIRLAKWAGELQRSLQNERARYEAIARGERAVWLTEKLGECVNDGALGPTKGSSQAAPIESGSISAKPDILRASSNRGLLDAGDPLGLLRWNEAMKRRGWIAFQVVGSFGILGAMAVWMAKTWGSESYTPWTWGWLGGRA